MKSHIVIKKKSLGNFQTTYSKIEKHQNPENKKQEMKKLEAKLIKLITYFFIIVSRVN